MKKEEAKQQVDKVLGAMTSEGLNLGDSIIIKVEAGETLFVLKRTNKEDASLAFPEENFKDYFLRLCYMANIKNKAATAEGQVMLGLPSGVHTFKITANNKDRQAVLVLQSKGETPNKG